MLKCVSKTELSLCWHMRSAVQMGTAAPNTALGNSHGSAITFVPRIRFSLRNGKYRRSELYRCGGSKSKGQV